MSQTYPHTEILLDRRQKHVLNQANLRELYGVYRHFQQHFSYIVAMEVGFTTPYAISAYRHYSCGFESHSGDAYSIQHHVIKFVSDLLQALLDWQLK
jgi:hypothetical protein